MKISSVKKRHQIQVTRKESEVISLALFWYIQYIPCDNLLLCKQIFDKYTRINEILR